MSMPDTGAQLTWRCCGVPRREGAARP